MAALVVVLGVMGAVRWPAEEHALTVADLGVMATALVGLGLVATLLVEAGRRDRWAELGDIRAQGIFRLIARLFAPPAAAAVLTGYHTHSAGNAVVVFGAMILVSAGFRDTRYPLHLSAVARFVFDLVMPAAGISLILVLSAIRDVPMESAAMVVPLVGAWFVTFAGGWLEEVFNAERPVRLAVIGEPGLAHAFAVEMQNAGVRDRRVVGWVSAGEVPVEGHPEYDAFPDTPDLNWLGSVERIRTAVLEHHIDLLVVTPRRSTADLLAETVERCVDLPVRMLQASHLYESMHGRVAIGAINTAWFAYIMHPDFSAQEAWPKRLIDRLVAVTLLVTLAPVYGLVALAVKIGDGGPVLFRQRRVGAHGREFEVLKFRTMCVDAEREGQPRWASANDERCTRVGRVLRRSHLDELPQLANVLKGEMSLVGPRPERPEIVAELEQKIPYYSRRVLVKPGITGWAQVRSGYGGSDAGTAFKLSHDLYYIKHRSLLFDLLTMIETIRTFVADAQYKQFTFSEAFILGPQPSTRWRAEGPGHALPELASLGEDIEKLKDRAKHRAIRGTVRAAEQA